MSDIEKLLSPERMAEIEAEREEALQAAYDGSLSACGRQYLRDTAALLAERAAFRALVAQQLAGLLAGLPFHPETADEYADGYNAGHTDAKARIRLVATALGITLP